MLNFLFCYDCFISREEEGLSNDEVFFFPLIKKKKSIYYYWKIKTNTEDK